MAKELEGHRVRRVTTKGKWGKDKTGWMEEVGSWIRKGWKKKDLESGKG